MMRVFLLFRIFSESIYDFLMFFSIFFIILRLSDKYSLISFLISHCKVSNPSFGDICVVVHSCLCICQYFCWLYDSIQYVFILLESVNQTIISSSTAQEDQYHASDHIILPSFTFIFACEVSIGLKLSFQLLRYRFTNLVICSFVSLQFDISLSSSLITFSLLSFLAISYELSIVYISLTIYNDLRTLGERSLIFDNCSNLRACNKLLFISCKEISLGTTILLIDSVRLDPSLDIVL